MRNPFKSEPTEAQIRAFRRGQQVPARVAQAAARGTGRRTSLAAQSAKHKKAPARARRQQS